MQDVLSPDSIAFKPGPSTLLCFTMGDSSPTYMVTSVLPKTSLRPLKLISQHTRFVAKADCLLHLQ
jgi:hypothetical protein